MHGLRSAVYATRFILSLSLGGASSKNCFMPILIRKN